MLKHKKQQGLLALALLGLATSASAHPGHGIASAAAGFMHTITGWDHILMMIAIGLAAVKSAQSTVGKATLTMPLTFLAAMAIGIACGIGGYAISGVETAVAASVMAMGVLLFVSLPINANLRLGLVALFGVFHGMAHGAEMNMQAQTILGVLVATALLHGIGYLLGSMRFKLATWMQNGLAVCMMALGAYALL